MLFYGEWKSYFVRCGQRQNMNWQYGKTAQQSLQWRSTDRMGEVISSVNSHLCWYHNSAVKWGHKTSSVYTRVYTASSILYLQTTWLWYASKLHCIILCGIIILQDYNCIVGSESSHDHRKVVTCGRVGSGDRLATLLTYSIQPLGRICDECAFFGNKKNSIFASKVWWRKERDACRKYEPRP